jgi:hypothetical protein
MASGGPRPRRSVRSGWTKLPWCSSGLPGVLHDSRALLALRWMMLRIVLREVGSWLYLAVKPAHVGVDVDGLA